ncbi:CPBP family intramembrane glutamic endopeptidase [Streptococcus panodentis]|uniref:CPBP family intramembrane metalloprotease n=1 Tax=Streptococcus panodentis TaxID=1581472 RepID=A0ABS5AUJ5_9STRE|nr:type II CAAX endopeptidase family protein [Streptococcus panodentis]MBP2620160.1 CPBP family intramembrane metalloprotease [Streptococcus panodentis]
MKNFKSLALGIVKWIGLIALSLLINTTPMLLLMHGKNAPIYVEILLVALYLILAFLIFRSLWQHYQKHLPEEKKKFKRSGKDIGFAFLFFLFARVAAIAGVYLNLILSGNSQTSNDSAIQGLGEMMSSQHIFFALLFVATLAFIGPIMEELIFRGFGTAFFFKKNQKVLAAIVTSVVFTLPHITQLTEFPTYFAIGLILYLSYARRGNLKDSMFVHILNNLPMAILLLLAMFQ